MAIAILLRYMLHTLNGYCNMNKTWRQFLQWWLPLQEDVWRSLQAMKTKYAEEKHYHDAYLRVALLEWLWITKVHYKSVTRLESFNVCQCLLVHILMVYCSNIRIWLTFLSSVYIGALHSGNWLSRSLVD